MYKLVVLSALLAVAAASLDAFHYDARLGYAGAPLVKTLGVAPIATPVVNTYAAHHIATPVVRTVAAAPVVAAPAPIVQTYAAPVVAAPAPIVQTYAAPAVAVGHAITKHVHYASKPVVTGYTSQVLKPDLGSIATPLDLVTKQRVLAPARTVATITPQVTQVEPELHVRKVPVDVPVPAPYVSEVEVRHPAPIIAAAPAVAAPIVEARLAHNFVAAAPAIAAAPIVETRLAHNFVASAPLAHNLVSSHVVAAAPAPIVEARLAHNVVSSPIVHSGLVAPTLGWNGLRTASVW